MLQPSVSSKAGHTSPPFFGTTVMLRTRRCTPPPHVLLHKPKERVPVESDVPVAAFLVLVRRRPPPHSDTAQLSGHPCVLHARDSNCAEQAAPPKLGAVVISFVRLCVPPPQDFEHVPNAVHADTTQSTAHGSVLHVLVSERNGHT